MNRTSGQWLLLYAGQQPVFPDDPHVQRVLERLEIDPMAPTEQCEGVLTVIQRCALYLLHHGRSTCVETEPYCHICPLRLDCPYANGAAA